MTGKEKVVKSAKEGELQHKVQTTKETKYKPKSIFEDYRKEVAKKKKVRVSKAKAGLLTQEKAERILQTGKWSDK